jgi:hypothetical protein
VGGNFLHKNHKNVSLDSQTNPLDKEEEIVIIFVIESLALNTMIHVHNENII